MVCISVSKADVLGAYENTDLRILPLSLSQSALSPLSLSPLVGEGLSVSPFASVFSQWMSREIPGSGEALRREFRRVTVLVLVPVVSGIEAIVMNVSCRGVY